MIAIGTSLTGTAVSRVGGGGAPPALPASFQEVAFLGDSITAKADSFAAQYAGYRTDKSVAVVAQNSRVVGTLANLDDGGNSVMGHVAAAAASGATDLFSILILANDLTTGTHTAARTNLVNLQAALKAGNPSAKVLWSPPLPYNPTGTPHPNKSNFDTQRALLLADCRNPAVWGQWADYYDPKGEHPDFANPATAAALFGDSVHISAAGDALLLGIEKAVKDTLLDPPREHSASLYNAAWTTSETDLAVGQTITRRMIVSGLRWVGHDGGVSIAGGGSPSVKVNGATPSGRVYNGDVVDLTLSTSASFETDTTVNLTIGGETRAVTYRTGANVTPAAYVHGDVVGGADGDTSQVLSGLTFATGRAVVMLRAGNPGTTVKLNGADLTLRRRETTSFNGQIELWDGPVTAGADHTLAITYPNWIGARAVSYGTVTNGSFFSATGNAPANEDNPHLTPSVTVPVGGIAVAGFHEYGGATITPATANSGTTLIDEGHRTFNSESFGIAIATRATSGAASFNFTFGAFARVIAVYQAG